MRHVTAALHSGGGAQSDVAMSRQEVTCALNRMFHSASQDVPFHVTAAATEETCSLMFRLFDRSVYSQYHITCSAHSTNRTAPSQSNNLCACVRVCVCCSSQSDEVSARSLQTALIALSSDNLLLKYRGEDNTLLYNRPSQ